MKRKHHASFCSEIDSLSLSLCLFSKEEQTMEIARVQTIKSKQEIVTERKRAFLLFHQLFSNSDLSLSGLPLAKHSLSPLLQEGKGHRYREKESKREETLLTDQRFHIILFH